MMILRTKGVALSIAALLLMFVASCSQPTGPVASGSKSFGVTDPPEHSSSNFNLATPTLSGSQTGIGTVTLTWSNGGATGPNILVSEVSGGEFYPVTGTWVGSVVKPNSGHTDVHMWNETLGEWQKVGEEKDGNFTLSSLAEGTYYFYVQEKSMLDATGQLTETFHSRPSNVQEIEVINCINVYSIGSSEQPGWNATQGLGINPLNPNVIIVKKGNASNSKFNWHFNLEASCPGYSISGHNVVVDVVEETAHGTTTANEDLTQAGRYLGNGIWYPLTVGNYTIKVTVDGNEIDAGLWTLQVIN
jgi:hypothetical protein